VATLLQPDDVVKLNPKDHWNQMGTFGFKWHLFVRDESGKIRKSVCGIVLDRASVEVKPFADVKAKDLCGYCFKGQLVVD
jgi:hypothetical protein